MTTKAIITQSDGNTYNFEGYLIALISDYLEKGARIVSDTGAEIRLELFTAWTVIRIINGAPPEAEEPALCAHYSDDCPLCEDQAAIGAESAKAEAVCTGCEWTFPVGEIRNGRCSDCRAYTRANLRFNEADCGGVFDGRGVISDADPGL